MTELKEYFNNDGDLYRYLDRETDYDYGMDEITEPDAGAYEVIFDVEDERYYCFISAVGMDEALGNFFRHHPHVTYAMILDHMEV